MRTVIGLPPMAGAHLIEVRLVVPHGGVGENDIWRLPIFPEIATSAGIVPSK
jgi:hypothetical protein